MSTPSRDGISQINPADAVQIAARGDAILIDVRDPGEVAQSGKAASAIHIPLATFRMLADPASPECLPELKQGKPVIVYCAAGGRAQMACQMLVQFGYGDVSNLGGLRDWAAAGGTLEP